MFLLHIKNEWNHLLSKKQSKKILNRANEYYRNDKERLRESENNCRKLSEEEIDIVRCLKKINKN